MPFNPGNIRKLNALGGIRPQATNRTYQKTLEMF